ncbi:hypothetical protein DDIC_02990 [Desulfovibrio desulfuricans]|uniref:Fe-S oxidoreductase n=2 Tax=Desulfovibrio desulfuricans TaxID=876 RepID=A0A4P7UGE4_DESDE|nr:hypothetical protein DDIC_02990 [Desulfovibrio desulfuricans]
MDQQRLHEIESHCTQESPPRCRVACPFGLDVRAFMARLAEGKPGEARKVLERHLPLPGILASICDHPCENACLRQDLGGSVAMHGLELSCMLAVGAQGRPLPLPPKKYRMAIMGAGFAGLVAAWDLSRKAYPVTVFHTGTAAEFLLARYPALARGPASGISKDFAAEDMELLARQKVSFVQTTLDAALLEKLAAEYDAVLVDADAVQKAASGLVPEESQVDAETLLWRDNICCAGWPSSTPTGHAFASPSRQGGQGRHAAQTMERVTSGVSLTAAREKSQGSLHTDVTGIAPVPRIEPALRTGDSLAEPLFSEQESVQEAERCLQCQCMICVRECVFLQKFKGYPRLYARQVNNNASIVKGLHTANAIINGCALCGQCEELCPENFSMAELCLSAREDMVERGFMPPTAHEFALEDMESASGPECALTLPAVPPAAAGAQGNAPAQSTDSQWLFFPGCQLAASRVEQTAALYDLLRRRLGPEAGAGAGAGVGIMLSCCGIPARWAGRTALFNEHTAKLRQAWQDMGKPRIMAACSSCLAALREGLPEAQCVSVWEVLDGLSFNWPDSQSRHLPSSRDNAPAGPLPQVFSVQDPCTARHDKAWLAAVRSLAGKCGVTVEEPRLSGASTACCGYGGLVWCAQPQTARAMSDNRAAQLEHPGLASCIMCRDRLAASGKECWHLLDLLFPAAEVASGLAPGPGLSARRANRAALRSRLLETYGPNAGLPAASVAAPVAAPVHAGKGLALVAPEALARLEERHILLSDVEGAVVGAEASGHWFENLENGHRLGSWRPRKVTFWVEYEKQGQGFVLHDAWCHRMVVPGSGGQEAADVISSHQCCTDGQRAAHETGQPGSQGGERS